MNWEHRKPLILQHITNLNPDVMGISDLDIDLIKDELEAFGYSIYSNALTSIFFKKDKFVCVT